MNISQFLVVLGRNSAQAGVLVLIVLLAQVIFRRQLAPRWRCALWLLLVARLAIPISSPSPVSVFNLLSLAAPPTAAPSILPRPAPAAAETEINPVPADVFERAPAVRPVRDSVENEPTTPPPEVQTPSGSAETRRLPAVSLPVLLLCIWAVGAATLLLHLVFTSIRLARRISGAKPLADPAAQEVLRECRERLGVRGELALLESDAVTSPALHGFLRPRLLLPAGFTRRFSGDELRFVLLHELAHLKRRDLPLNWLIAILQVTHWFNPLVWVGFAHWRADRELACDALALEVAGPEQNRPYGETILKLLECVTHRTTAPGMVGILEDRSQLSRRIRMIGQFKPGSRWSLPALLIVSAVGAGCLTDGSSQKGRSPATAAEAVAPAAAPAANAPKNLPAPATEEVAPLVLDLKPYERSLGTATRSADIFGPLAGQDNFDGLPFRVDGMVILFGSKGQEGRRDATGLEVGQKFDELHLLHVARNGSDPDGTPIAVIRLNYADGTNHDFPIRYGIEVRSWEWTPLEGPEKLSDPGTKVIWRGNAMQQTPGASARVFKTTLRNPYSDEVVQTIDLISSRARSSYCLFAATVARSDPARKLTPAVALPGPEPRLEGLSKITIRDAADKHPIAGALVVESIWGTSASEIVKVTDAAGIALVPYPIGQSAGLQINLSKDGYGEKTVSWRRGDIPDATVAELAPSVSIGGTVVDELGHPLARTVLNLFSSGADGGLKSLTTRTDSKGQWTIAAEAADIERLRIEVRHTGFATAFFFSGKAEETGAKDKPVASSDLLAGNAVLVLSRGVELTGTVRDETGQPVPKATLLLGESLRLTEGAKADTDGTGAFTLKNLIPGDNHLTCSAPGFAPEIRSVAIVANGSPLAITLHPAKVLRGKVVDAAGKPVPGAKVEYSRLASGDFYGRTLSWSVVTGEDGAFAWNSPPNEAVYLSISKTGYVGNFIATDPSSQGETRAILHPVFHIRGTVTDAASGKAVSRFKVIPGSGNQLPDSLFWRHDLAKDCTQAEGEFDFAFDSGAWAGEANTYSIKVVADGYVPFVSRSFGASEGAAAYDVRLTRGEWTAGQVVSADGKPCAGVGVELIDVRPNWSMGAMIEGTKLMKSSQDELFAVDDSAHFRIPPQEGDYVLVVASANGFAAVPKADFQVSRTIRLQPWSRVDGIYLNGGKPASGKRITWQANFENVRFQGPSQSAALTDRDGRFTFATVPPGSISFNLLTPGKFNRTVELMRGAVAPGESMQVRIAIDGRPVTARLVRGAGFSESADFGNGYIQLQPATESETPPKDADSFSKIQAWYREHAAPRGTPLLIHVESSGLASAEMVPVGKYRLSGSVVSRTGDLKQNGLIQAASIEIPPGDPAVPVDLGTLVVNPLQQQETASVAVAAKDFEAKAIGGGAIRLSDFKGKFVLLNFWASWSSPCADALPALREAYRTFSPNARFAMVGLSLDQTPKAAEKFVKDNRLPWPQGYLGDWSQESMTSDYGIFSVPSTVLIGPDGSIIARNLAGDDLKAALAKALAAQNSPQ
jgi:beta-lactamase regulating signal transducer with metallopeptidase domain/peroxiredoxin